MEHAGADEARQWIVEALPSFVLLLDREHRILFINRLVAGLTMDQVIGTSALGFIPPDYHGTAKQAFEQVWTTGKPTRYQIKGAGDHGTLAWYSSYVGPVIKGGEVVAITLVTEDITAQKLAEEQRSATETRFRAAIEGSLDAFVVLTCDRDASGKIVDFVIDDLNARGAAMIGLPREECAGSRLCQIRPKTRDGGFFAKYVRVFESQEVLAEEHSFSPKEGVTRWVSHQLVPLPDGVAITSREITAAKQLEADLREALRKQQLYAEEIEQKHQQLRAMSAPIIQAWQGVLVLPVIGALDGARAQQMMEKLLAEMVRTRARFAVLDLTGVDAADASTAGLMLRIIRAANLLGSRCLVSGIAPAVAQTMVEASAAQEGFMTFGLLQDALRYALLCSGVLHRQGA